MLESKKIGIDVLWPKMFSLSLCEVAPRHSCATLPPTACQTHLPHCPQFLRQSRIVLLPHHVIVCLHVVSRSCRHPSTQQTLFPQARSKQKTWICCCWSWFGWLLFVVVWGSKNWLGWPAAGDLFGSFWYFTTMNHFFSWLNTSRGYFTNCLRIRGKTILHVKSWASQNCKNAIHSGLLVVNYLPAVSHMTNQIVRIFFGCVICYPNITRSKMHTNTGWKNTKWYEINLWIGMA